MRPRRLKRWIVGVGATLFAALLALLAATFAWPLLAPHVLELGRLHGGISVGDAADPLWTVVEAYCDSRPGTQAQCSRGTYASADESQWKCADGSSPAGYIAVHDWVLMDDVQLHLQLDADDRVCASVFWAD